MKPLFVSNGWRTGIKALAGTRNEESQRDGAQTTPPDGRGQIRGMNQAGKTRWQGLLRLFGKMAFRNVWRNTRRSLITMATIAVGVTFLVVMQGFRDGFREKWVDVATRTFLGHIQVHSAGYFQSYLSMDISKVMENWQDVAAKLPMEKMVAVAPRMDAFGFASTGETSHTLRLVGALAPEEAKITSFAEKIVEGDYLSARDNPDRHEIIIGVDLKNYFKAEVGDRMFVMIQTFTSDVAYEVFFIKGIFRTRNPDVDNFVGVVHLETLRKAMAQDVAYFQDKVSGLVIRVRSGEEPLEVAREIQNRLGGTPYEVKSWEQMAPDLVELLNLIEAFTLVMYFILFLVAALNTMNTVLMAVMERVREFGVMVAEGTEPNQIVLLVVLESVILGVIASALGLLLGTIICIHYGRAGFDLSHFSEGLRWMLGDETRVFFRLTAGEVLKTGLAMVVVVTVAGLYPALRASRLKPVEALRYV
jgi:ABC-type lipoprotein release transport system permease subunit